MSPYIFSGLGSAAYALIKADGQERSLDSLSARYILLEQKPHGIQAINTFLLREHHNSTTEEAYHFAMDCFRKHRGKLTPEVKSKLLTVMEQIMEADNRISPREINFMEKFKDDLEKF
ncbi:hypothetical protein [Runella sp. SP2]|uniref:hypothetical protein n=1 Tax=Runella sp. SP2 TaxID=2268026 RepID=UPI0013DE3DB9|nr:hypothetical protein [Runella sp. SP2]